MDKFAKRAAIAGLALLAVSVTATGVGLVKVGSQLEKQVRMGKSVDAPQLTAAIKLPSQLEPAAPVAQPAPPPQPSPASETKPDLASAFGAALGVDVKKHEAAQAAAQSAAAATPSKASTGPETLELGFTASSRDAKLGNRDAKAMDVRRTGGEEQQLKKKAPDPSERISFETDIGAGR